MPRKVAYLTSRFPKISETFILYEILELRRLGLEVEIFPLLRHEESVRHPEADLVADRVHYASLMSSEVLSDQLYWLLKRPLMYMRSWLHAISGNIRSRKFLLRALVTVPLAAHFARRIAEYGIDHVHAHWATHPALAAYVIKMLTGIPYSITAHAHDIYVDRSMLDQKLHEASFIITISRYNRQFLKRLYGTEISDKTLVIHCGVDSDLFQPRRNHGSPLQLNILCIASLEERKGHSFLIDACHELKKQRIPFRLRLVGDGERRSEIEAQIRRLSLTDCIQLHGWQPRNRVHALLREADVMVLPSTVIASGKTEGIPVALMEALAMEVPVVSTNISGIPELVEHEKTGLLVPEKDSQALVVALKRLYENPWLAEQLGKSGRAKVLRDFNLHNNSRVLFNLFSKEWRRTKEKGEQRAAMLAENAKLQNPGAVQ